MFHVPNLIESLIKYFIQQIFIAHTQVKGTVLDAGNETVNKNRQKSCPKKVCFLIAGGCWISSTDSVIC